MALVNTTCTIAHTLTAGPNGTCVCYAEFSGPTCDKVSEYWRPLISLQYALSFLYLVVALYWSSLRLVILRRRVRTGKERLRLSIVVMILIALASILRIISHVLPATPLYGDDGHIGEELGTTLAVALIVPIPPALWMVASLLIVAFWYDVITGKLQRDMAERTKIACIVLSALLVLMVPGLGLFAFTNLATIGTALTVAPLVVDTVALVVLDAIITRFLQTARTRLGAKNEKKTLYALRLFWLLCASWILYMANLIFGGLLLNSATLPSAPLQVIYAYILLLTEMSITFTLLSLGDRDGSPWRATRQVCCSAEEMNAGHTETTSGASSSNRVGND